MSRALSSSRDARRVSHLARTAARYLARHESSQCGGRVEVDRLAQELGVEVISREKLHAPARWHRFTQKHQGRALRLWESPEQVIDRVEVRAGLRDATRRFALAHELGHVVLHREHHSLLSVLSDGDTERFANVFAAELLVPPSLRRELRFRFRDAADPVDLLRLGDFAGVPPRTLLRFARTEQWLRGTDLVWFDVRRLFNRFTGRDKRLRIYDVVLDRGRWYVPTNRSVAGVFGSDRWLSEPFCGEVEAEARIELDRRLRGPGPRFQRISAAGVLKALRLPRAQDGRGLEVLAVARLLIDQQ